MRLGSIRAILLSLLSASALLAQVDPRLQASKTDVLDVYFGSTAQGAPPEIITLIDNSQSMCAVYWSRYYYADADSTSATSMTGQSWHNNQWGISAGDFNNRLAPIVYTSGLGSAIQVWVNLHPIGGGTATAPSGGAVSGLKDGVLIKPNGDPVVYSDVNSTDPKLWVQRASHVRFAFTTDTLKTTYTYNGTGGVTYGPYATNLVPNPSRPRPFSGGNYTSAAQANLATLDQIRVVDFPLPWALFDPVPYYEGQNRTLTPAPNWPNSGNGGYSTAVANKHPQHTYIYDPVPDSTGAATTKAMNYEVDAVWSQGYNAVDGILAPWTGATNAQGKIGSFHYNADYLWWIAFGQDVRNQTGTGAYLNGMVDAYSGSNGGGYSVKDVREGGAAWNNGLPGMTRFQAIKKNVVQTYVNNQSGVQWAIRFFFQDPSAPFGNGTTPPTAFDSNNTDGNPGNRQLLKLLQPTSNSVPDVNMQYILTMVANSNTPLTNAVMNAYAQFANTSNGNTIFNPTPPSCTQSFLIILSDGAPTDAGGNYDPYATGVGGNAFVNLHPSYLSGTTGGSYNFNNFYTAAAIAAHYPTSSSTLGMPTDTNTSVRAKVPWAITARPSGQTRRVSTMTIGVSLEGTLSDPYGGKKGMYAAALYGWEKRTTPWDINNNPPAPYDPSNSATSDKLKNPFFFDATDPDKLSDALTTAFSLARSATNTMGAPVAPLVGLSVGKQTYIGTFITSESSVWSGDLLMSGLSVSGSSISVLDKNGAAIQSTTGLNASNSAWSAALSLAARGWKNRNLFTLTPGSTPGAFTNTSLTWNESMSTATLPNSMLGLASTDTAGRLSLIRFMMGASTAAQVDTAASSGITTVRPDIMGDIINSTPLILEFPLSGIPSTSSILTNFVSNLSTSLTNLRFRLIIVGDNQGLLHGFGEVSGIPTATATVGGRALVQGVVEGDVDELWAFIPPDILSGLQAWRTGTTHRYLVDGSPTLYLNERGIPNGIVDGTDFARVLFGLRKGGRSYYCLKFNGNDPAQPLIDWKIRPDEVSPSDITAPNITIKKMGFSSSTPTIARVTDGSNVKDVFLIGGGLTTVDVDTAFSAATIATPPGYGAGTKLGRSILAVNVVDGSIVKTWDFVNDATLLASFPTMGSIPAAVTPVEAIANSFATQRVYFTDTSGGAYVLGAMPATGFRADTNALSGWSVRHLYTPKYSGTVVSVPPVVFRLQYGYPVTRTTAPTAIVPTLGVIFGTGDRNDPLDMDTVNPGGGGTLYRNRLLMVLDRQDSADITGTLGKVDTLGFTDDDLADLTAITSSSGTAVDPTNSAYYLKAKFGYYLNYTVGQQKTSWSNPSPLYQKYVYQKSVTPPIVLNNVLFFTNFAPSPTASVCSGSGTSMTYRMCDVINPVYSSGTTQATASICNGYYATFNDIPSELASVGLAGVLQAGEVQNAGTGTGTIGTSSVPGQPPSNMPRPRGWRIIR